MYRQMPSPVHPSKHLYPPSRQNRRPKESQVLFGSPVFVREMGGRERGRERMCSTHVLLALSLYMYPQLHVHVHVYMTKLP